MMSRGSIFKRVGGLHPARSQFDLSYSKLFTCDMGQLIPVMCDEVVPADIWKIGCQAVLRLQPMVAPIMHQVDMYAHTFFVPYRLLWDDWEKYITGGIDGQDVSVLPRWDPTDYTVGSLWDFMGFPPGIKSTDLLPMDFPKRAYNLIYNEYYRDETITPALDINAAEAVQNRLWRKDYFTSSLLWQQRGISPALPITGMGSATWDPADFSVNAVFTEGLNFNGSGADYQAYGTNGNIIGNARAFLNNNTVDLSAASTFDIADLRLAFQIQKWMERNARCGVRLTEFIMAHFGVHNGDDRLQRPEYIGGTRNPIIVSEVLQTSETGTSPQGNLAGHGIGVNNGYIGSYRVKEHGLIMTIMSVMPVPMYQDGINRQWLRETRYDFMFPEFVNLSEQAVTNGELLYKNDATYPNWNNAIFGYQGRFDEMRVKHNMVCSQMRETFDYWHLGRKWDQTATPHLNQEFLVCNPRKDIFAVPSEPGLIINFGNIVTAYRPLPVMSNPGLIDHN